MKKNRMMRLASVLLVLCLLTTSVISGTFAKYTTTAEYTDSARVAYWGFDDDDGKLVIEDLFLTAYKNANSEETVKSADADEAVIAPGTSNSVTLAFNYDEASGKNAPEVDYTFDVSTAGSSCADPVKENTYIVWKLDGVAAPQWTDGNTTYAAGSFDALLKAIEALEGAGSYKAGNLPTNFADTHTVGWDWPIGTTDAQHKADTKLGNEAIANTAVTLSIQITATQVD